MRCSAARRVARMCRPIRSTSAAGMRRCPALLFNGSEYRQYSIFQGFHWQMLTDSRRIGNAFWRPGQGLADRGECDSARRGEKWAVVTV